MKKNNGITLIALIITIVVMLILVAVTVSILAESDLIGSAEKTGDRYKAEQQKEQTLGQITIGNKTYASINDYMNKNPITDEEGPEEPDPEIPSEPETPTTGYNLQIVNGDFETNGGAWYYSVDGGETWVEISSISSPIILSGVTRVRFKTDQAFFGDVNSILIGTTQGGSDIAILSFSANGRRGEWRLCVSRRYNYLYQRSNR